MTLETGESVEHRMSLLCCVDTTVLIGRLVSLNNPDFKVYLDDSCFRIDPKFAANLEMRTDPNSYPTIKLGEKYHQPQAPYMETP